MSGRKGLGVKADDLITKLEEATLAEVTQRHADMAAARAKSDRARDRGRCAAIFSAEVYAQHDHCV